MPKNVTSCRRILWSMTTRALDKSRKIPIVFLISQFDVIMSITLIICITVE